MTMTPKKKTASKTHPLRVFEEGVFKEGVFNEGVFQERVLQSGGCCGVDADESREVSPVCAEWQAAAKALSSRSFASFEDAVGALAEVVLKRMGDDPGMDRDAAKEFLEDLLITDPQLEDELRKTLNIRDV